MEAGSFQNYSEFPETSWEDELGIEEGGYKDLEEGRMELLNRKDYNLNSPIIVEGLYGFISFVLGESFPKILQKPWWIESKDLLITANANLALLYRPDFHKDLGRLLIGFRSTVSAATKFHAMVQKDSDETWMIPKAFLLGWLGSKKYTCPPLMIHDKCTLVQLQGFLIWHYIVLLMNSVTTEEKMTLFETGLFLGGPINSTGSVLITEEYGEILITSGIIWFSQSNLILDQQFCLMMKDLYAARYHSLAALHTYNIEAVEKGIALDLQSFYRLGDMLMMKYGNQCYNTIKLIEPTCNLRLCELAHQYRPLVPDFPSFGEYVRESTTELENDMPGSRDFLSSIMTKNTPDAVLVFFGVFRHWGHPAIDYLEGLQSLYENVTKEKNIDLDYADALASDLAYMILRKQFCRQKKWFVDLNKMEVNHSFFHHILDNTWPTLKQIRDFGDKWHLLPLTKCFDIPDVIDPSQLYSDKSHSMQRSEVLNAVQSSPNKPIKTLKVLKTLLSTKEEPWGEFLQRISDNGLDIEDLVIGLKGKEREVKIKGRFYSLMSWKLRQYFVITEYLIKEHFVPLFDGLTMADDLSVVTKKLLKVTEGQGSNDYQTVGIANHLDYEKWNNHQRKESTSPVFKVMGQFLGYPQLIERTHQFFEESLVYYKERPDLMSVQGNTLVNRGPHRVTWDGQKGGLEGLRQKGWSVLNLLIINREAVRKNVQVSVLAQGDNQVICTKFRIRQHRTQEELSKNLRDIARRNVEVMTDITRGTVKLGLTINQSETMQSADFLSYGKIPVFRGTIYPVITKRWARLTCLNNDQLPGCASIGASAVTNAMMVSHYDTSPVPSMVHYHWASSFVLQLIGLYNPALRKPIPKTTQGPELEYLRSILYKYLDPILGGICGVSLTRFLIRQFPDPLTESLSFWKVVYPYIEDKRVQHLIVALGNPRTTSCRLPDLSKLLENPMTINIRGGINIANILRGAIKDYMIAHSEDIQNSIIKAATCHARTEELTFLEHLASIHSRFPRFLSEYRSATFLGIVDSIVNLYQNSRTFREHFGSKKGRYLDKLVVKSELLSILSIDNIVQRSLLERKAAWDCSSTQADRLRRESWGEDLVGATIPHPIEMLSSRGECLGSCPNCSIGKYQSSYVTVSTPRGLIDYKVSNGFMPAYLGSRTSEGTNIYQPYERSAVDPFMRRVSRLRTPIDWFVKRDSILAKSIFSTFMGLTGEDWSEASEGFQRTGSAFHR